MINPRPCAYCGFVMDVDDEQHRLANGTVICESCFRKENPVPTTRKEPMLVNKALEDLLKELDSYIGLEEVKKQVISLINQVVQNKKREEMGVKHTPISLHMVFTGNPGTGKTFIARLLARIFRTLGLLKEGQLVETDRGGLIADYMGMTASKTKAVVESALGGVLFIDEAYSLDKHGIDVFGKEAVDTLLKEMEDHRNELIVILAGYTKEMTRFINANPGLKSLFSCYIHFEDYKPEELYAIFCRMCNEEDYTMTEEAADRVKKHLAYMYETRTENFANAREVRLFFKKVAERQIDRVFSEKSDALSIICGRDIDGLDPENKTGMSDESKEPLLEKAEQGSNQYLLSVQLNVLAPMQLRIIQITPTIINEIQKNIQEKGGKTNDIRYGTINYKPLVSSQIIFVKYCSSHKLLDDIAVVKCSEVKGVEFEWL